MIEEDYVSFETAKLLKEKGFDWNTDKQFNLDKIVGDYNITDRSRYPERYLDAPTLQMAMKWLREEKKLSIIIQICFDDDRNGEPGYYFEIWKLTPPYESQDTPVIVFDTYEEACEAAIKYYLENLI